MRDAFRRLDSVLGVLKNGNDETALDGEIEGLIAARNEARRTKNFAESDRIRDELLERGIVLKDTPQGTVWERKR